MRHYFSCLLIFPFFTDCDTFTLNSTTTSTPTSNPTSIDDAVIADFVPIGKDLTTTPPLDRPLPKSVGKVISHRTFTEDGIKYTEVVRKTPMGGTQVATIKGDVNPSLLPVPLPMPDLSKVMRKLAARIHAMRQEPIIEPQGPTPIHPVVVSRPQTVTRVEMVQLPPSESFDARPAPVIYRPYADPAPGQYPPFMYESPPYGLLGRVGSMTGNILDNVMDFVVGRRRRR